MHYLTGCLIFKDSASYLEEWIRFHLTVGFEHLYLYDNDSSDNFRSVVRPFVERGQVTLCSWPGLGQQSNVFQHCLDTYRGKARWIAFLDDDEFLFPSAHDNLQEILPKYEQHAGLAICWLLFGSSGHRTRPPGLVTQNYCRRADWVDWHVKCVVDPSKVIAPAIAAHAFYCNEGSAIVDENYRPTTGAFSERPSADIVCLNHYLVKSEEEIMSRRMRPRVCGNQPNRSVEEWKTLDNDYNTVEDHRIQRFAKIVHRQQFLARFTPLPSWRRKRGGKT